MGCVVLGFGSLYACPQLWELHWSSCSQIDVFRAGLPAPLAAQKARHCSALCDCFSFKASPHLKSLWSSDLFRLNKQVFQNGIPNDSKSHINTIYEVQKWKIISNFLLETPVIWISTVCNCSKCVTLLIATLMLAFETQKRFLPLYLCSSQSLNTDLVMWRWGKKQEIQSSALHWQHSLFNTGLNFLMISLNRVDLYTSAC